MNSGPEAMMLMWGKIIQFMLLKIKTKPNPKQ
jgi:hypothetical protein